MGCETGNCPTCKIEVGAINVIPPFELIGSTSTRPFWHLFILYSDQNKKIVYRGGPEAGNRYSELAKQNKATEWKSESSEILDFDYYFGTLITHRMEGLYENPDVVFMVDSIVIAEGPEYCGLDEQFSHYTRLVGELGKEYDPISAISTDNSNATVRTILHYMGLREVRPTNGNWVTLLGNETDEPNAIAPGWNHIFDLG